MKLKSLLSLIAAVMLISFSINAQETYTSPTSKKSELREINTNLPFHKEPVRVNVEVIDENVFFQGDILLGNRGEIFAQQAVAIDGPGYRWPNATIPYSIEPGHPQRDVILRAVAHINKSTNLNIIPRTTEADYVHVINSTGCWSYVGRRGGKQSLSVTPRCSFGSTVHEFCHAAGLWHEQSRCDRDNHIALNLQNVTAGKEHNFAKHCSDGIDIGPYDFGSIMHYSSTAFSKNGQPTIISRSGIQLGQRNGLSTGDINGINTIYPKATPPNPNPNPNPPNPPTPQLDPVEIYVARQFKGTKMELGEGMHDFKKLSSKGISGIRSIKIPDGYKVTAYTGNAGGGQVKEFTKSINYIGMPYRSIKIEVNQSAAPSASPQAKPGRSTVNQLALFVGKDGKGKSIQLKPGNYTLDDLRQKGVTVFRSVQLPEGYKARVFTGAKFNGKSRVIDKSMNLNSPSRSIKIVKE